MTDGGQNMLQETSPLYAVAIQTNFGPPGSLRIDPFDGPWNKPANFWPEIFKNRQALANAKNLDILEKFTGDPDAVVAAKILGRIAQYVTEIAISQEENPSKTPKSWKESNPTASENLTNEINLILEEGVENPLFRQGLMLIRDVLVPSKDPNLIYKEQSKYLKACIDANAHGKVIFYIPFLGDFTNPTADDSEIPNVCDAVISILIPLDEEKREKFNEMAELAQSVLGSMEGANKIDEEVNILVGYDLLIAAGFGVFTSTVGEAFVLKNGNKLEHGIYLAINNLVKNIDFWKVVSDDPDKFFDVATLLNILHELGHRFFPETSLYGELVTDIPTVISAFEIAKDLDLTNEDVARGVLTEYVSGIMKNTPDLSSGSATNENLVGGYYLSSVVIMNEVASAGIAKIEDNKLVIDASPEKIAELSDKLKKIKKENLGKVSPNSEVQNIINFYSEQLPSHS